MAKYFINYHTGAGNTSVDVSTIEDAKELAVDGISYTQEPVTIELEENGKENREVAYLPWYGVSACEDDFVTADYGKFGFYGAWVNA